MGVLEACSCYVRHSCALGRTVPDLCGHGTPGVCPSVRVIPPSIICISMALHLQFYAYCFHSTLILSQGLSVLASCLSSRRLDSDGNRVAPGMAQFLVPKIAKSRKHGKATEDIHPSYGCNRTFNWHHPPGGNCSSRTKVQQWKKDIGMGSTQSRCTERQVQGTRGSYKRRTPTA